MNNLKTITEEYYINNAKKLHDLTDQILIKLQFVNIDNEDFYSLANEIFVNALNRYDGRQADNRTVRRQQAETGTDI